MLLAISSIIPADNVIVAIVIGAASGLTATGANQIIKQLSKSDEETTEDSETEGNDKTE